MWGMVQEAGTYGSVTTRDDGSISVGGFDLDQDIAVTDFQIGDALVSKEAGPGGEIVIRVSGEEHHFKFLRGDWYYHKPSRGFLAWLFGG